VETTAEVTKVESQPPRQPPRPNKKLVGTTSTNGELVAYVRNEGRRELPLERVGLNESIDDGTLVLVHPRGIVVQVEEQAGEAFAFRYYVYRLGTPFTEREELNPEVYPGIREELDKALVP
jgi:hypothetical protein